MFHEMLTKFSQQLGTNKLRTMITIVRRMDNGMAIISFCSLLNVRILWRRKFFEILARVKTKIGTDEILAGDVLQDCAPPGTINQLTNKFVNVEYFNFNC